MLSAGAVCKGMVHLLLIMALVGCATGGSRSEMQRCIPYYNRVGIEVLDLDAEDIASRIVRDAISSMGYSATGDGYATPSKGCFIMIEKPSAENIEIVLYVSERQPSDQSEWIGRMKDALMNSILSLEPKDQLVEVFEVLYLEESFTGRIHYPP